MPHAAVATSSRDRASSNKTAAVSASRMFRARFEQLDQEAVEIKACQGRVGQRLQIRKLRFDIPPTAFASAHRRLPGAAAPDRGRTHSGISPVSAIRVASSWSRTLSRCDVRLSMSKASPAGMC